ncbi:sulfotransferase family 2 domain-containing protein [Mycolicibacterium sp. PAM1]|uniref:sulfotransferase family 2 domain-containing protein n=1 Tax=Mycolicibacterium sp. PAM1 TaxID=2853535 RepID=UPI0020CF968A|nr:sulfotransferase family 2 domain-containing protein [Mycolicibacterium sp. PAM1]
MPILDSHAKKVLYIHIPKTGGTSVEHLLRSYGGSLTLYSPRRAGLPCAPQHFHGEMLNELLGLNDDADDREHNFDFVFMTVRHPVSRLLSEYRHQRTMHQRRAADASKYRRLWAKNRPVADMLSFDHWCRYALMRCARDPFFSNNHLRPQVEFSVWDPVVYRLEDGLEPIRQRLDEILGSPGSLPREPRKLSTDRSGRLSDLRITTRRMIQSEYARDFSTFDYEFD